MIPRLLYEAANELGFTGISTVYNDAIEAYSLQLSASVRAHNEILGLTLSTVRTISIRYLIEGGVGTQIPFHTPTWDNKRPISFAWTAERFHFSDSSAVVFTGSEWILTQQQIDEIIAIMTEVREELDALVKENPPRD